MNLSSNAFSDQGIIPAKFTCDGQNVSPQLSWTNPPKNTASFVLIVDDLDAPNGLWTHWALYNIPASISSLQENIKNPTNGTNVGLNSWSKQEYNGPCPPSGEHRYFFKLYALDIKLEFNSPPTSQTLQKFMNDRILATATIMGLYSKNK